MKINTSIPIVLLLIILSLAGCGKKESTLQPAAEPVLLARPELPVALTVKTSQRFEQRASQNGPPQDFGKAIALGEGLLAIGAPDMTSGDMGQNGSVFIYRQQADQWVEETRLYSSDQDDGFQYHQHFGAALAFSGDMLFVGAPGADDPQAGDESGAVYVFQDAPGGWQEVAHLTPESPRAKAGFGSLLSSHGDSLAVGEGYDGTQVHIFQREAESWKLQASLTLPVESGARPGLSSLALYGDTLAVSMTSMIGEGELAQIYGHLLLYERSGTNWGEPADLFPAESGDCRAAVIEGDGEQASRLAFSYIPGTQPGLDNGGVLIYERGASSWEQSASISIPDNGGEGNFYFASVGSIALDGDLLVAGMPGVSEDSLWDGVAYIYQYHQGRWVDQLRLTPTEDGGMGDFFGSIVTLHGQNVLISAPDEFGNAVYVYEIGERE